MIGEARGGILIREGWRRGQTTADVIFDEFCGDIAALGLGGSLVDTAMVDYLPRASLSRYDFGFAKHVLACSGTVVWKLFAPEYLELACVAVERLLPGLLRKAREADDEEIREGLDALRAVPGPRHYSLRAEMPGARRGGALPEGDTRRSGTDGWGAATGATPYLDRWIGEAPRAPRADAASRRLPECPDPCSQIAYEHAHSA
jgi:hypothetical protein